MSDSTSHLNLIETAQAQKEVTANGLFNAASPATLYARNESAGGNLVWAYYGGRWNGTLIANGTVTLDDGTVGLDNYIVAARATGAVSVSTATTNWDNDADYMRCYRVFAAAGQVTSYEDHRQAIGASVAGGGGASTFTALTDVPASYTGEALKVVRVNAGETALEFAAASSGDVTGPASATDNALPRFDGTGGKTLQGSGVLVGDSNEISGYIGHLNAQTGTTYTLVAADTGKVVECTNAAAITLTLPATAAEGFCCTVVQGGAGQITLTPAGSATSRNRQSHTKTAGKWAAVTLYVRTNAGGSAAEYVMCGDSAA